MVLTEIVDIFIIIMVRDERLFIRFAGFRCVRFTWAGGTIVEHSKRYLVFMQGKGLTEDRLSSHICIISL